MSARINLSAQKSLTKLWLVPKAGTNKTYLSRLDKDKISREEGIRCLINNVLKKTQKGKYNRAIFYDNQTGNIYGWYVNEKLILKQELSSPETSLTKLKIYFLNGGSTEYYSDIRYDAKSQVNGIRRLIKNILFGTLQNTWQTAIFYDRTSDKMLAKYVKNQLVYQNKNLKVIL